MGKRAQKKRQSKLIRLEAKLTVAEKRLNKAYANRLIRSIEGANKMIVGSSIEDLEVPHEPGNKIGIRQLSGLEMDDAKDVNTYRNMKNMGLIGAEALEALRNDRRPQDQISTPNLDPIDEYDHEFLLTHAIVRWSGPYYSMECNEDNKKLLDQPTKDWIIKEIVNRNVVPLVSSTISVAYTNGDTLLEN